MIVVTLAVVLVGLAIVVAAATVVVVAVVVLIAGVEAFKFCIVDLEPVLAHSINIVTPFPKVSLDGISWLRHSGFAGD